MIFKIKIINFKNQNFSVFDLNNWGLNFLQNESSQFSQIYLSPGKLSKVFTFQSCKWLFAKLSKFTKMTTIFTQIVVLSKNILASPLIRKQSLANLVIMARLVSRRTGNPVYFVKNEKSNAKTQALSLFYLPCIIREQWQKNADFRISRSVNLVPSFRPKNQLIFFKNFCPRL